MSTTAEVITGWNTGVLDLASSTQNQDLFPVQRLIRARDLLHSRPAPAQYESALMKIPERLDHRAFLWNVIEELKLFDYSTTPDAQRQYDLALAWYWAASYVDEYRTTMVGRMSPVGMIDCGLALTHPTALVDLIAYDQALTTLALDRAFRELCVSDVTRLLGHPRVTLLRDWIVRPLSSVNSTAGQLDAPTLARLANVRDEIRDVVSGSSSAIQAFLQAAEKAARFVEGGTRTDPRAAIALPNEYGGRRATPMTATSETSPHSAAVRPHLRVLVIVALQEEFRTIFQAVVRALGGLTVDRETSPTIYRTQRSTRRNIDVELVLAIVGKGQNRAGVGTALLGQTVQPDLIVTVGIAGALSNDVVLGDVVLGTQVVSYLDNARFVKTTDATPATQAFDINPGGDGFRSDSYLADIAEHLEFAVPDLYADAQRRIREAADPTVIALLPPEGTQLRLGPIATGPGVGAAKQFKEWLLKYKRDYLALDMESASVALAADQLGKQRRVRFLALRGISDFSDAAKRRLEAKTKGRARQFALVAALEMLQLLLDDVDPRYVTS